ncbi:MAG: hypothetical protein JO357_05465 [Hyphomicrobiales bacterium]|nr:hypothetical protein [Hyphomicrobiales bacterium]MBV9592013.1 hypothetical protein [Hyphomicrobiales bacterium]
MSYRDLLRNKLAAAHGRAAKAMANLEEQRQRLKRLEWTRQNTAGARELLVSFEQSVKLHEDECLRLAREIESAERGGVPSSWVMRLA